MLALRWIWYVCLTSTAVFGGLQPLWALRGWTPGARCPSLLGRNTLDGPNIEHRSAAGQSIPFGLDSHGAPQHVPDSSLLNWLPCRMLSPGPVAHTSRSRRPPRRWKLGQLSGWEVALWTATCTWPGRLRARRADDEAGAFANTWRLRVDEGGAAGYCGEDPSRCSDAGQRGYAGQLDMQDMLMVLDTQNSRTTRNTQDPLLLATGCFRDLLCHCWDCR